jgi:hypothetical protein
MRILDEDNDRSCDAATLFLTRQEATLLGAMVAALLESPPNRHEHVNSDDQTKELTICLYDPTDLSGLNERSQELIKSDK